MLAKEIITTNNENNTSQQRMTKQKITASTRNTQMHTHTHRCNPFIKIILVAVIILSCYTPFAG